MIGRHPGELLSSLSSSSTSASLSHDQEFFLKDVVDQRLPPPTGQLAEEVVLVVSIAVACTRTAPESRSPMSIVAQKLSARTRAYLSEPFQAITIGKLAGLQI